MSILGTTALLASASRQDGGGELVTKQWGAGFDDYIAGEWNNNTDFTFNTTNVTAVNNLTTLWIDSVLELYPTRGFSRAYFNGTTEDPKYIIATPLNNSLVSPLTFVRSLLIEHANPTAGRNVFVQAYIDDVAIDSIQHDTSAYVVDSVSCEAVVDVNGVDVEITTKLYDSIGTLLQTYVDTIVGGIEADTKYKAACSAYRSATRVESSILEGYEELT